ncbi:Uncharacterised protein [[Clostridium] sordellii]|uniref:hypothetical protein n=1 Tax=Paraclostridium sordellii TaxID=1505 RepID=UPI0005E83CAA|nr:hypothetical protein [Paeniclostridium sordellii]CEP41575.1 Uncharacterised protein [[Clostridium] sordellii] [Paeniclostridium sordellii]
MKIYMTYKEDTREFNGFYQQSKDNDVIPKPNICISSELRWYLQQITQGFKIKDSIDHKEIYTIEDKDIFEIIPFEYEKPKPTRIDLLEKQNAFLVKESLEKDIQIKKLNISLAQATLNSVKKDIELKKMNTNIAQTTLNLVKKDIQIKAIEKEVADLVLKVGGK